MESSPALRQSITLQLIDRRPMTNQLGCRQGFNQNFLNEVSSYAIHEVIVSIKSQLCNTMKWHEVSTPILWFLPLVAVFE